MEKYTSIGHKIAILNRYSQTYFSEALKEFDIHGGGQIRILMTLAKNSNGVSQESLAKILMVDKASISRVIRPLISNGLIERKTNPQDQRAYLIQLADSIQDKIPFIFEKARMWSQILTKGMSEQACAQLYASLEILDTNSTSYLKGESLEKEE